MNAIKNIFSAISKNYIFLIFILLLFSHFPFLTSDPDAIVDIHTRGAWTDEGLYSSQIRNWVNHHGFSITENTTFIRGPLYSIIQAPFFKIFGTSLVTGRLITLMFIIVTLYLFCKTKNLRYLIFTLILTTLTQFHIFQFSHYCLAEMICISFILLSMLFLIKYYDSQKLLHLFISIMLVSFAFYTKIQYLYAISIPVISALLMSFIIPAKTFALKFKPFLYSALFTILFTGFYYLCFYLPNREFYMYIMNREVSDKIPTSISWISKTFRFNFDYYIYKQYLYILFYCFLILLPAGIYLLIKNLKAGRSKPDILPSSFVPIIFSLVWTIVELHKLSYTYLPMRYLLSLFFSAGLFISCVINDISIVRPKLKAAFIVMLILWAGYNLSFNYQAYSRRTYDIESACRYISKYDFSEKPVLGSWAPSLCWKNKTKTLTIWNNYINSKDPINTYKPRLVIAETNDDDSENAFKDQKIDLLAISDSVRVFNIWRYKVGFYWIKQYQHRTKEKPFELVFLKIPLIKNPVCKGLQTGSKTL